MNRIRLLPEQVANQIAAGEVVERPASAVKELVENALDAKATRLTVEIQTGGRSLIRVTDDGTGMSRDDILLALERHATSKIRQAKDLFAIDTMGFRGEALPSIASISRMTLTSQERGSDEPATQILINGGKIAEVRSAGSPAGTCVEVRQLFYNLPARRKFLRSEETEYAHIHHYLTLAALAHPSVAFTFVRDGRTIWQLPPVQLEDRLSALRERMRGLSGLDAQLLPVDYVRDMPGPPSPPSESDAASATAGWQIRVWGLIGRPGLSRATRQDQHLFVNRRPVQNRGLNIAMLEGYHTALMKGRFPVCCLFLECDSDKVDVNIHPAKREVKFHNERAIRQAVTEAVRQTLLDYHNPAADGPTAFQGAPATTAKPHESPVETSIGPAAAAPNPVDLPGLISRKTSPAGPSPEPFETQLPSSPADEPAPTPQDQGTPPAAPVSPETAHAEGQMATVPQVSPTPLPLLHIPLRLVGVIGKLYVVLESDRGMVLMDQHAAHERILFEQMLNRLEQGEAPSQRLLLPETVELPVRDALFLKDQMETLNRLGVGLSEFGDRTFLLDALPPFVKAPDARQFMVELVDELKAAGQAVNTLRLGEQAIAKTVCRHAVKANDPLAVLELEKLLEALRECTMPYTCPHGRPTLIELSFRELEKKFGRLV